MIEVGDPLAKPPMEHSEEGDAWISLTRESRTGKGGGGKLGMKKIRDARTSGFSLLFWPDTWNGRL